MTHPPQQIRFCTSQDGVQIAYATSGNGPPLVRAPHWATHLEFDWESPVWRPWLSLLAHRHTLIRYDQRGFGLSDRNGVDLSFERHIEDLEAVVDAAGFKQFVLTGMTGGGPIAIAYAARHPDRVSHLVLYGTFTRGRIARAANALELEEAHTLLKLIEIGLGRDDPAFRQFVTSQFFPDGTAEQFRSFNELVRQSASPSDAATLLRVFYTIDIREIAPKVRCPTLVLHPSEDARVPFEEGRALAGLIPGARLVALDSRNHILLEQEPAWKRLVAELDDFLPSAQAGPAGAAGPGFDELTAREHDVLELVAQGLDNTSIGEALGMSEKTVRNHVSTIFSKLDVKSRAQAVVRAREAGFGGKVAR